jgi:serine protease Do/serine protease DegQ
VALRVADSDKLRVGDFVVAIGNPFGLEHTVTSGIVSALGRRGLGTSYEDFIQTDAAINPGNSGGALVNLRGELVGINTAIYSRTGGSIGIGFAIPANMATSVVNQLVKFGEVKRGYIGAQMQDLNPELADAFGVKERAGAVLVDIEPESPADAAGLKPGDIVVSVDNRPVTNASDLRNRLGLARVGDKLALDVVRNGKRDQVTVRISERRSAQSATALRNPRLAGITFGDIDPAQPQYGETRGVVVVDLEPQSLAARAGLRPGDVILSVNRGATADLKQFLSAIEANKGSLLLQVRRGNAVAFLVLK